MQRAESTQYSWKLDQYRNVLSSHRKLINEGAVLTNMDRLFDAGDMNTGNVRLSKVDC